MGRNLWRGIIVALNSSKPEADTITRHGRTSKYFVGGYSDTVTMHLDATNVVTETAFMLIDISNTTNWKHTDTGHCILDYILIQADPDGMYLGDIKIGFLQNVDENNGDFNELYDLNLARKSDLFVREIEFGSHGLHCQPETHFGPIIADSLLFQTDVSLGGPDDPSTLTYPSGPGDLVMIVGRTAGTVDVSVTLGYETVE